MVRRYENCQREDADCEVCSLSSYGKDCKGNPVNWIGWLRVQKGYHTQTALAKAAGMDARKIRKIESGEIEMGNITLKNALALAEALGVEPKELME